MNRVRSLRQDQRGMVSFLVTLIMLGVITLIVVGFTQVANRNAREALDRELSAQAFYAAESGVNVTSAQIKAAITAGTALTTKATCANNYDGSAIAPLSSGVQYTCVLVDPTPSSLVYNDITRSNSVIIPVEATTNLTSLNFSWSKKSGAPTGTCTGQADSYHPAAADWDCGFGILRVDLVQVTNPLAPPNSAGALYNYTNTMYLSPYGAHTGDIPALGAGNMPFNAATKGYIGTGCDVAAGSTCVTPSPCDATCTVDFKVSGARKYYVRATMIYADAGQLTISGKVATGPAQFINGQTMIDVTGKAQDELRRIQVRLAADAATVGGNAGVPLNALTSTNTICKRFTILPTDTVANPPDLCQ